MRHKKSYHACIWLGIEGKSQLEQIQQCIVKDTLEEILQYCEGKILRGRSVRISKLVRTSEDLLEREDVPSEALRALMVGKS